MVPFIITVYNYANVMCANCTTLDKQLVLLAVLLIPLDMKLLSSFVFSEVVYN